MLVNFYHAILLQKYAKEKIEDTEFHQNLPQLPDPEKKGLFDSQLSMNVVPLRNIFNGKSTLEKKHGAVFLQTVDFRRQFHVFFMLKLCKT